MAGRKQTDALEGMFDGRLAVQPPLTEDQLRQIPASRGVFLLSADDGQPVLLATAASIRRRLRGRLEPTDPQQRKRTADLRSVTRTIRWRLAGGHFEMDWHYLELARALWPKGYTKLLSWRPPWFVRVDAGEEFPHFSRTREPLSAGGTCLGPFESGRSAERFIDVIQDAFDLCRDVRCLRRSPDGERCAYGQMARCLCPCDGTVSMDAYRRAVAEAAALAEGRREGHVARLEARMKSAAAALRFEEAAAIKARLARLAELDGEACAHVRPVGQFQFLLVQRSGSRRRARVFLSAGGSIAQAKTMDYPLQPAHVRRALRRMSRFAAAAAGRADDDADRWRMGLVSRTLFSSPQRRGLVLRWHEAVSPDELSAAIDAAAGELALSRRGQSPPEPAGEKPAG